MAKQIKVREDNYFAVQGWMVAELKLKGNALMLYAIIYGFSQTTNTAFTGSVDYLCEWLGGVSRPTVINTLDNLVKQGLLTKSIMSAGERVMERIWELDIPLQTISDKTGISRSTIYAFLYNGTDLSSMRLAKICSLLGLSMDYVMGLKQELSLGYLMYLRVKEKKIQYLKSGLKDIQYIIWIIHTVIAVIIKRISRVRI